MRTSPSARRPERPPPGGVAYKWIALSNTTVGMLMATIDASIVIIALPAIFRGIHLDPLAPSNFVYLLWLLLGYLLVTAVLVVTVGRIGDIFGRVRMYNLGFAVFTAASIALSLTWSRGSAGAIELISFRMIQGIGGAMLMANSAAILTDAFPAHERGMAMGINQIAALAGSFIGLVLGGILASIDWRWVFWINVPIGIFGTVWAYLQLRELGERHPARIDWLGNLLFAAGLAMLLVGITSGIRPHGASEMSWGTPLVIGLIVGGVATLGAFIWVELRVHDPMFDLHLFQIRAFAAGNVAALAAAIGRGGLQFMLIIWLQGIWLPMHGYSFERTPLWAGIYMLPLTTGFLVAGPLSGRLSDRYGARPFATGGMLLAAVTFGLLMLLPANFAFPMFATVLFFNGIAFGLFSAPNTTAIMNSVPARHRGAASGMRATFMNTGFPLSIGVFFSLMIVGLAARVPAAMQAGLTRYGVSPSRAASLAHLPPVGYLFAAFLGSNPLKTLLGPKILASLSPADAAHLTGHGFFPSLIGGPFKHGLVIALSFSIVMCLIAAAASWLRGARPVAERTGLEVEAKPGGGSPTSAGFPGSRAAAHRRTE